jgi:cell division protein ZapA
MEELSIKIKIADREYPMKVKRDDEERVRLASRLINEKLKSYKDQFGLEDKQDLLAMVAFDSLVEKMTTEETTEETHHSIDQSVYEKVTHLNHLVSQSIL